MVTGRELAIAIIKSWVDEGMGRQEALDLYNDITRYKADTPVEPMTEQDYDELPEGVVPDDWQPIDPQKVQLEMLEAMSKTERKVYLLTEAVASERYWLDKMLQEWKADRSYSLSEIKEQRKKVQTWQKRLNAAKQMQSESEPNGKQSQSSSH